MQRKSIWSILSLGLSASLLLVACGGAATTAAPAAT